MKVVDARLQRVSQVEQLAITGSEAAYDRTKPVPEAFDREPRFGQSLVIHETDPYFARACIRPPVHANYSQRDQLSKTRPMDGKSFFLDDRRDEGSTKVQSSQANSGRFGPALTSSGLTSTGPSAPLRMAC